MATAPESSSGTAKVSRMPASETVAALRILVQGEMKTVNIPAKGDREARTLYKQPMAVIGGPRPLVTDMTLFEEDQRLEEGCYALSSDCLMLNQYGRLEVRTGPEYVRRLRDMKPAEQEIFKPVQTDLSDFG